MHFIKSVALLATIMGYVALASPLQPNANCHAAMCNEQCQFGGQCSPSSDWRSLKNGGCICNSGSTAALALSERQAEPQEEPASQNQESANQEPTNQGTPDQGDGEDDQDDGDDGDDTQEDQDDEDDTDDEDDDDA